MPPLLPVPGVARVVCNLTNSASLTPAVNIFHVQLTPPAVITQADIDIIASGVRAAYVSRFLPLQAASIILGNVVATDLTNQFGVVGTNSGTSPGGIASGFMPPQCAVGLSWTQNMHYRGGHPRTYLPGPVNGQLTTSGSNLITAAAAALYDTAAEGFRIDILGLATSIPARLVLVRRIAQAAVLDPPIVSPIISATVDRRLDTQRRRLGKDIA